MKIALLSGKGGVGKTLLAVNLAYIAGILFPDNPVSYIDCDVEEPNGHLFFNTPVLEEKTVHTLIPQVDKTLCTSCRKCVDFCKFNALVFIRNTPMLLSEMCHSCGSCFFLCKAKAIQEIKRPIGIIQKRQFQNIVCLSGVLNIGEASGVKVIKEILREPTANITIIDCPPGSACPVMESIEEADFCLLVAEPTAFGLHNLAMVYELASLLGKKCGIVINKEESHYTPLYDFCKQNNIPVLGQIPYKKEFAASISDGKIASALYPELQIHFEGIFNKIIKNIGGGA